ncbi:MAG: ammonia-forming cytochrome c nitrite reductase subunit c552 [Chloroflexi bacterium]|nr:ammonia-forming cytochrome c nitrite reductase subunit c552 [Chloroflexota bacterium]
MNQYDTFEIVSGGKTFYGGSDAGGPVHPAPKNWSKTSDLPYWNMLIDGHPFVLETYEDRPMAVNQIEHQETIRPGSEACMECHGTRAAFMKGFEYMDKNGVVHSIPAEKTTVTLPSGAVVDIPAKEYTVKYKDHTIYDGTSYLNDATGEWMEIVNTIVIPMGTKLWTYTDGVNLSGGAYQQKYQVKTLVTLPAPVTVDVLDKYGNDVGDVTFQTIASYPEAGADINGMTGFSPPAAADGNVATVARNWIYSAMEALAFDGLDYYFNDPQGETHFTGGGANWPSIESGELCNQCHDPHSGKLRIVRKALIAAIAERGINPYSPTGSQILTFEEASRQDQIIAVCAQCHSEYVGGYSANTKLDQDYFPWAKPADLENQYRNFFGYLQDWTHGGPIVPWQSTESNARGFYPYGERFVINAPLVKVQHPEAEEFFNSPMYNAGATCTDCHSTRLTGSDGKRYTSHWFTSPLKLMEGFAGETLTGVPIEIAPQNPCAKCHTTDSIAQSTQRIKSQQDNFFVIQERAQVALVNALKFISAQPAGTARNANVLTYQRAAMRWEYYTQAENSMGFHNNPEAVTEVANARIWVDNFIPWPLTPVSARIASVGSDTMTLVFYDQANNETGFIVERAPALEGPYIQMADIPTPNGTNLGDVEWTDVNLDPETTYFYRVAAYNASGISIYSIWAEGTTQAAAIVPPGDLAATAVSSSGINLAWTDNSLDETGFRIERAKDENFTVGRTVFNVAADVTAFNDTGLAPATTYYYRVFAFNDASVSAPTNTASAVTFAAPPAAPTKLVVKTIGQTSVTLAWKDNSGSEEDGFYIERSDDGGKTWVRVGTVGQNFTTFTNTGLARRKTYLYRVQAYSLVNGESGYSNVVSAKTK